MHTPENISQLGKNEIFVFGSNLLGRHYGGSAKLAYKEFGAIWGIGYGLHGKSFAIPTLAHPSTVKLKLHEIETFVNGFFIYAKYHPELTFYFTKIGCGIAGFKIGEISSVVMLVPNYYNDNTPRVIPPNVILPKEFHDFLKNWI